METVVFWSLRQNEQTNTLKTHEVKCPAILILEQGPMAGSSVNLSILEMVLEPSGSMYHTRRRWPQGSPAPNLCVNIDCVYGPNAHESSCLYV